MAGILFFLLLSLFIYTTGCKTANMDMTWSTGDNYFSYYSLNQLEGRIQSGWADSGETQLWTWAVSPENYTQTVLFIHGYLDHSALNLTLFKFLNKQNCRIIAYDLPGHGRSGGQRAGLNDFDEYSDSLIQVINYWNLAYEETIFMGHSTGGGIILDSLINGAPMKKVVLAAPLLQFRHFDKAAFFLTHFLKGEGTIGLSKKKSSSNREFNQKKERDPMKINQMPLNWPRAIIKWQESLPDHEVMYEGPILVFQGEKDHVVFFERNIDRISRWFPQVQIHYYPGLKHHLLNENNTNDLYDEIARFINQ